MSKTLDILLEVLISPYCYLLIWSGIQRLSIAWSQSLLNVPSRANRPLICSLSINGFHHLFLDRRLELAHDLRNRMVLIRQVAKQKLGQKPCSTAVNDAETEIQPARSQRFHHISSPRNLWRHRNEIEEMLRFCNCHFLHFSMALLKQVSKEVPVPFSYLCI